MAYIVMAYIVMAMHCRSKAILLQTPFGPCNAEKQCVNIFPRFSLTHFHEDLCLFKRTCEPKLDWEKDIYTVGTYNLDRRAAS